MKQKANTSFPKISPDLTIELEVRKGKHQNGCSKSYSWQNVKKAALKKKS